MLKSSCLRYVHTCMHQASFYFFFAVLLFIHCLDVYLYLYLYLYLYHSHAPLRVPLLRPCFIIHPFFFSYNYFQLSLVLITTALNLIQILHSYISPQVYDLITKLSEQIALSQRRGGEQYMLCYVISYLVMPCPLWFYLLSLVSILIYSILLCSTNIPFILLLTFIMLFYIPILSYSTLPAASHISSTSSLLLLLHPFFNFLCSPSRNHFFRFLSSYLSFLSLVSSLSSPTFPFISSPFHLFSSRVSSECCSHLHHHLSPRGQESDSSHETDDQ